MKSPAFIVSTLAIFILFAACSGGSSTTLTQGTNGLPFAEDGLDISEIAADGIPASVSAITIDPATGDLIDISDFVYDLEISGLSGDRAPLTGQFPINGELVTFVDGVGQLSSGEDASLSVSVLTDDAYLVVGRASFGVISGSIQSANSFGIIGFETSPDIVSVETGTATYTGGMGFALNGHSFEGEEPMQPRNFYATSAVQFEVDFASNTASGELTNLEIGAPNGNLIITGDFESAQISQNGFVGNIEISCGNGFECTGDGEYDASFFGTEANTIGGTATLSIDAVRDTDDVGLSLTGVGGFILER